MVKANLILIFSTITKQVTVAYQYIRLLKFEARGVIKVTTQIIGLWHPSVHMGATFYIFDVGSSYYFLAELAKCRIVHPLIGKVGWVYTVVRQVSFTLLIYLVTRQ